MGASGWWYRCDYDPDPAAALRSLRNRVFESGDYQRRWDESPEARAGLAEHLGMFIEMAPEMLEQSGVDGATLERLAGGAAPASIDEARLWAAEDGTHSILDVGKVGDRPSFGVVTPLDGSTTESLFGSTRPTPGAVEAAEDRAFRHVKERWTGHYVTAYDTDGDQPTALFFFGVSGD